MEYLIDWKWFPQTEASRCMWAVEMSLVKAACLSFLGTGSSESLTEGVGRRRAVVYRNVISRSPGDPKGGGRELTGLHQPR